MTLERRFLNRTSAGVGLQKRADGKEGEVLQGYGIVFYDGTPATEYELWTGVRERINPSAVDGPLSRPDDVRGLFNHNPDNILGRSTSQTMKLTKDKVGLRYEIDLPKHSVAEVVREAVSRQDVSGSSFMFTVTDVRWFIEGDLEIREIRGITLYDIGPVTFPAYEGTSAGLRGLGRSVLRDSDLSEVRASYEKWKSSEAARVTIDRDIRNRDADLMQLA